MLADRVCALRMSLYSKIPSLFCHKQPKREHMMGNNEDLSKLFAFVLQHYVDTMRVMLNSCLFIAKSIPIHCIIEKTLSKLSRDDHQLTVDVDSYAIVPHNTPFADIVRTALIKIGYTSVEASRAKGRFSNTTANCLVVTARYSINL